MLRRFVFLLLPGFLVAAAAPSATAQAAQGGPFRRFTPVGAGNAAVGPGGLTLLQLPRNLEAKLQLTPEQQKSLLTIRRKLQQDLRTGGTASVGATGITAYQGAAEIQSGAAKAALEVLDRGQRKRFHLWERDYRAWEPLDRAALALLAVDGLDEEQKTALTGLTRDTLAKRQELLQTLARNDHPAARAQAAAAVAQNAEAAVRKTLRPEQQKQFDAALRTIPAG